MMTALLDRLGFRRAAPEAPAVPAAPTSADREAAIAGLIDLRKRRAAESAEAKATIEAAVEKASAARAAAEVAEREAHDVYLRESARNDAAVRDAEALAKILRATAPLVVANALAEVASLRANLARSQKTASITMADGITRGFNNDEDVHAYCDALVSGGAALRKLQGEPVAEAESAASVVEILEGIAAARPGPLKVPRWAFDRIAAEHDPGYLTAV